MFVGCIHLACSDHSEIYQPPQPDSCSARLYRTCYALSASFGTTMARIELATEWIRTATSNGRVRRYRNWVTSNLPAEITQRDYAEAKRLLIEDGFLLTVGGELEPARLGLMAALDVIRRMVARDEEATIKTISNQTHHSVSTLNVAFAVLAERKEVIKIEGGKITSPAKLPEPEIIKPRFRSFDPVTRALKMLEETPGLKLPELVSGSGGSRDVIHSELLEMQRDGEVHLVHNRWWLDGTEPRRGQD